MAHRLIIAMTAFALLAFGLTGCTIERETGHPGDSGRQIVFTPSVENEAAATRAANNHPIAEGVGNGITSIPDGEAFGMYAYHSALGTGTDIALYPSLANQKVTRDGTTLTYTPAVSWPSPSTSKLAFFGYYPWTAQTGTPNPAVTMDADIQKMTVAYTVPTAPAQHIDLMYTHKGLTAGYDPVPIVFGHALTWLRFSAKAENYTEQVKITRITVKNALTKGTLTVLETGTPTWTLTTDKANYEISTAGGGLTATALTDELAAVNTAAGHMLVLPQDVAGLVMEVEATLGGVAFTEPFVYSLDGSTDWMMNRIVTYQIVLSNDEMAVTTKVDDWKNNNVNVVYDGQWFLSLTKDVVELEGKAGSGQLVAKTNYNTTSFGYPVGLQLVPTVEYSGSTSGWLTVSGGSNGALSRTLTFTATDNTIYEERSARVKIKAGNLTKVIYVTQAQKLPDLPENPGVGNAPMTDAFVGAFWKAGQRGERLVSMPISSAHTGKWAVQVLDYGGFSEGDILFGAWDGQMPLNDFPNGDTPQIPAQNATYLTGNISSEGNLQFKIGLKQTIGASAHRYARVIVSFGVDGSAEYAYNRVLWLRQGEMGDYLMAAGDVGLTSAPTRPAAVKFLPCNLTADTGLAASPYCSAVAQYSGISTAYPTQAGALWQFSAMTYPRYAYSPVTVSGSYDIDGNTADWTADQETCPGGYRRPAAPNGSVVDNEFYQSLIATESSADANSVWGYYADGYFDRYTIDDAHNDGSMSSAVNPASIGVGYIGRLFYNPVKGSSHYNASLFFPAAGSYISIFSNIGNGGYYWSSSMEGANNAYSLRVNQNGVNGAVAGDANTRGNLYTVRCVQP